MNKSIESIADKTTASGRLPFSVVEAYKTIRTNLQFVLADKSARQIVITSPLMGDGKSTTAINMAIAFSQAGCKTLIIDGDLRKPTVHKKLRIQNTNGLSSLLAGMSSIEDSVSHINSNLDVVPSGPLPPNPSELLSSNAMANLLKALGQTYEYIFIDTPPVNIVSDALALAPKTDGMVIVVRDNHTTYDDLKKSLSMLEFADIHLLGIIVNGGKTSANGKYKPSKYSDYGYRYAYK